MITRAGRNLTGGTIIPIGQGLAMPHSTSRLSRALASAEQVHAGVLRKHTSIPYLAHVMGVSVIVLEAEGTEDEAIAGLLDDTLEDWGTQRAFAHRFARGSARACSRSLRP